MVYKCLNGLMVMPPNTFAPLTYSSWNLRSHDHFILHQPFAHTYTLVSPTLSHCGTICLYLFITVCLFPLLNLVLRILFNCYHCRVYFTLASYLYILCVSMPHEFVKKKIFLKRRQGSEKGENLAVVPPVRLKSRCEVNAMVPTWSKMSPLI